MASYKKGNFLKTLLFLITPLIITAVIAIGLSRPSWETSKASYADINLTITSPSWGTTYRWKDRATITAEVDHLYPIDRVVFQFGHNLKNVCVVRTEPFICTYTVPYTGGGSRDTAGYSFTVYAYDTMGNVNVKSLQLWSYK